MNDLCYWYLNDTNQTIARYVGTSRETSSGNIPTPEIRISLNTGVSVIGSIFDSWLEEEGMLRRVVVQGDHTIPKGQPGREPGTVTWIEHYQAWQAYSKKYGNDQSAERIEERGGFGYKELVTDLGREPLSWEPRQ